MTKKVTPELLAELALYRNQFRQNPVTKGATEDFDYLVLFLLEK